MEKDEHRPGTGVGEDAGGSGSEVGKETDGSGTGVGAEDARGWVAWEGRRKV